MLECTLPRRATGPQGLNPKPSRQFPPALNRSKPGTKFWGVPIPSNAPFFEAVKRRTASALRACHRKPLANRTLCVKKANDIEAKDPTHSGHPRAVIGSLPLQSQVGLTTSTSVTFTPLL